MFHEETGDFPLTQINELEFHNQAIGLF